MGIVCGSRRLVATLAAASFACTTSPTEPAGVTTPEPKPPAPTPAALEPAAPPACQRVVHIEVRKSERLLRARCARGALVTMTAAMGREPLGHKRTSGDLRTPEGRYEVTGPAQTSRFHAFVPIDYPSVADADEALAERRIGARDHARILAAHARGEIPPSNTPLGGGIGFHGEGTRWAGDTQHLDWTLGCVAVTDAELDFLIARIQPGVTVEILP